MDFELFRPQLNAALAYMDRTEGGRLPFDPVLMLKILVIQATNKIILPINAPKFLISAAWIADCAIAEDQTLRARSSISRCNATITSAAHFFARISGYPQPRASS